MYSDKVVPMSQGHSHKSVKTIKSSINEDEDAYDEDESMDQFNNKLCNSFRYKITEENESKEQTQDANTTGNNNQ